MDKGKCIHCGMEVEAYRGHWWRGDDFMCPDGEHQHAANPPGWNEPGMQPITWADENPDTTSVEVKRAAAIDDAWRRFQPEEQANG